MAPVARRVPVGSVAALAGYLLFFPPIFVLAPLAGLLIISRPRSLREWWWLAGTGLAVVITCLRPGGLGVQLIQAWGVLLAGAFLILLLWRQPRFLDAALLAVPLALSAVTLWLWGLGLSWKQVEFAFIRDGWQLCRMLLGSVDGLRLDPARAHEVRAYIDTMGEQMTRMSSLYPAILVLVALPGLALAWNWYHRIASTPLGRPAARFVALRFNDHLVWGLVLGIGLLVFGAPVGQPGLGANLVMVFGALYAARGAAIATAKMRQWPVPVLLLLGLMMMFLLPLAVGALVSLGLADTWLDFRRPAHSYTGD